MSDGVLVILAGQRRGLAELRFGLAELGAVALARDVVTLEPRAPVRVHSKAWGHSCPVREVWSLDASNTNNLVTSVTPGRWWRCWRRQRGGRAPNPRRRVASPQMDLTVEREAGAAVHRTMVMDGERLLLGSQRKKHLVLEDPRVSRFHCSIERTENAWRVVDSGSLNGTQLLGVSVRDADLPASCTLVLGDSTVSLREVATEAQIDILDQASFGDLYGQSLTMQRLFAVLEKIASSDAYVLIEGESGTGKELVAAELVRRGSRSRRARCDASARPRRARSTYA